MVESRVGTDPHTRYRTNLVPYRPLLTPDLRGRHSRQDARHATQRADPARGTRKTLTLAFAAFRRFLAGGDRTSWWRWRRQELPNWGPSLLAVVERPPLEVATLAAGAERAS